MVSAVQWNRVGADFHLRAISTMSPASRTPYPNRWLNSRPAPLIVQLWSPLWSFKWFLFEVKTARCWISLQVSFGLNEKDHGSVNDTHRHVSTRYWMSSTLISFLHAVKYLGFYEGVNFRWSLVLTQRGAKPCFLFFHRADKKFAKGAWPNAPPLNTPLLASVITIAKGLMSRHKCMN